MTPVEFQLSRPLLLVSQKQAVSTRKTCSFWYLLWTLWFGKLPSPAVRDLFFGLLLSELKSGEGKKQNFLPFPLANKTFCPVALLDRTLAV